MIANTTNICLIYCNTPKLRPLRALFLFFLLAGSFRPSLAQSTQSFNSDTLIHIVQTGKLNDSMRILLMHRISYILSETDIKKSFAYYERVSRESDSLNFTFGKALANINLGILLASAGNFDLSNKAYLKAIDLAKLCSARRLEAVAMNNAGENFASLKDFNKCRQYTRDAIEINSSLNAWRGVAVNYELLNRCDMEEGLYDQARMNLDMGMPYAQKYGGNYVLSQFYTGYASLHAIYHRNDSANFYFKKALSAAKQTGDIRNVFQAYIAEVKYMKPIPVHERTALLMSALELAQQTHYQEGIAKAANELSSVYDELKKKDSSVYYYAVYKSVRDSLFSESNRWNVFAYESEWIVKKKELENVTLKELTAAQRKQIAFKNILLLLAGIGFLLALFVAFLLYKSFQVKKSKDESQFKQKIAETEMQALQAQMNPHFFFNSLNSIENFIMQNEKKLASDYLNKFARFVRGILDSSNNELIELKKDIESLQLYIDLEQLRFNHKFRYFCKVDPELMSGEYHVPALLVQPFLENAINHGIGPSDRLDLKICVKVKFKNNMIHYIIEDNGIGREQSRIYNKLNKPFHKSVGMKLTQDRINIFNGPTGPAENVKIIDLYDDEDEPIGTRIEFAIKAVTHASTQSHFGR